MPLQTWHVHAELVLCLSGGRSVHPADDPQRNMWKPLGRSIPSTEDTDYGYFWSVHLADYPQRNMS